MEGRGRRRCGGRLSWRRRRKDGVTTVSGWRSTTAPTEVHGLLPRGAGVAPAGQDERGLRVGVRRGDAAALQPLQGGGELQRAGFPGAGEGRPGNRKAGPGGIAPVHAWRCRTRTGGREAPSGGGFEEKLARPEPNGSEGRAGRTPTPCTGCGPAPRRRQPAETVPAGHHVLQRGRWPAKLGLPYVFALFLNSDDAAMREAVRDLPGAVHSARSRIGSRR